MKLRDLAAAGVGAILLAGTGGAVLAQETTTVETTTEREVEEDEGFDDWGLLGLLGLGGLLGLRRKDDGAHGTSTITQTGTGTTTRP